MERMYEIKRRIMSLLANEFYDETADRMYFACLDAANTIHEVVSVKDRPITEYFDAIKSQRNNETD